MARKGNQQKNGVDRHGLNHKKGVSGGVLPGMKGHGKEGPVKVFPREELADGDSGVARTTCDASFSGDDFNNEQKSENISRKEKQGMAGKHDLEESLPFERDSGDGSLNSEASVQEEDGSLPRSNQGFQSINSRLSCVLDSLHLKSVVDKLDLADNVIVRRLRFSLFSMFTAISEWLTRQTPLFVSLRAIMFKAYHNSRTKVVQAYPVILKWLMHFGNVMLLLSVFWLDCALRGIDSFVRMGTTPFFSVIWCSIFSVISMIGVLKFLAVLVSPGHTCRCLLLLGFDLMKIILMIEVFIAFIINLLILIVYTKTLTHSLCRC